MTFSTYLKSFADDDTIIGDVARDFIVSKSKARTFKGIIKHMENYRPCGNAIEAVNELNCQYLTLQLNNTVE